MVQPEVGCTFDVTNGTSVVCEPKIKKINIYKLYSVSTFRRVTAIIMTGILANFII